MCHTGPLVESGCWSQIWPYGMILSWGKQVRNISKYSNSSEKSLQFWSRDLNFSHYSEVLKPSFHGFLLNVNPFLLKLWLSSCHVFSFLQAFCLHKLEKAIGLRNQKEISHWPITGCARWFCHEQSLRMPPWIFQHRGLKALFEFWMDESFRSWAFLNSFLSPADCLHLL